jgi:hypothetical protein
LTKTRRIASASVRWQGLGVSRSTEAFAPARPLSSPSATSTVVRWSSSWGAANDERRAAAALSHYAGHGAVRLLAAGLATAAALEALI